MPRACRIPAIFALGMLASCSSVELEPASQTMVQAVDRAGADRCQETVASSLQSIGVEPDEIRSISTDRRTSGSGEGTRTLVGYTFWTDFNGFSGRVITYTTDSCMFQSIFSRGGVSIENGRIVRSN